jgi:hypothetical protein
MFAAMIICLNPSLEADVEVTAYVDKTELFERDRLQLTIEITGGSLNLPQISLPELADFVTYSSGTTQNVSFVNGQTQVSKSFSFALVPKRTGKLKIPPMSLTVDGKEYSTPGFDITVRQSSGSNGNLARDQAPQQQRQTQRRQQPDPKDLFITTSVDEDTVYVNEQVTLTFRFYQAQGVDVMQEHDYSPPQKTGFWVEDLPPRHSGYKTLNNRRYHVTEIKSALFPTTAGEQTIGAANLELTVRVPSQRNRFSVFDDPFFGFGGRGQPVTLESDPIDIVTLPLPAEGKPEGFTGAVGSYKISATADKNEVEVNQPITLTVRVSGEGNIKSVSLPEFPELPDFRTYSAGDRDNMTKVNYRVGGSKSFEQVFIPKRAGNYTLPAVEFSYFDPKDESYHTVSTQPIDLKVVPATDRYVSQVENMDANQIDLVAKDIRYLKQNMGRVNGGQSRLLAVSPLFMILYLLPIAGYLLIAGQKRRRERLQQDVSYRRLKQARKMAERRLKEAGKMITESRPDAFYAEVSHSIVQYFGDRFNLPSHGLTADSISSFAKDKLDEDLTDRLLDLLAQCDFGRFAPGGAEPEQMQKLWQQARDLIVELEKSRR